MAPVLGVSNRFKSRKNQFEDARICYSKALLSDRNVGMQSGLILVALVLLLLLFHPTLFFVHYFLLSAAVFAKTARNRLSPENSSVSDTIYYDIMFLPKNLVENCNFTMFSRWSCHLFLNINGGSTTSLHCSESF
jgi:hypothetical protein